MIKNKSGFRGPSVYLLQDPDHRPPASPSTILSSSSFLPSFLPSTRSSSLILFTHFLAYIAVPFFQGVARGWGEDQQGNCAMSVNSQIRIRLQGPLEASHPGVLAVLRSDYLVPPSTLPYNLTLHKDFNSYVMSYTSAWKFYHHYIKYFFGRQGEGFFVEAGALDGEFLFNTLWLETILAWSGLLIEAEPNNYRHLVWKRRRAWISNTCILKENYPKEAVFEVLSKATKNSKWLYNANTREINTYITYLNDELSESSERAYTKAQCFPLISHLLALNVTLIDFLSLDIQGHEWSVLQTLPLDRLRVRSIAVEHLAPPNTIEGGNSFDKAFVGHMKESGYHLVDVYHETDYFFVLQSDTDLRRLSDPKNVMKYYEAKIWL